jgi:hypothetical protein
VTKQNILEEANGLINGARQADYGHPIDDFTNTSSYWTTWLRSKGYLKDGVELKPEDVPPMMVLLKLSRESNRPKRDNKVDGVGYFGTWEMVEEEQARRAHQATLNTVIEDNVVVATNGESTPLLDPREAQEFWDSKEAGRGIIFDDGGPHRPIDTIFTDNVVEFPGGSATLIPHPKRIDPSQYRIIRGTD